MARKKADDTAYVSDKGVDPICANCRWVSTWREKFYCGIDLPPHVHRASAENPRFVSQTNTCSFFKLR